MERIDKDFFRPVFEAANPMIVTNTAGLILFLNQGAEELFGYSRDELRGKYVETLMPHRFRAKHPALREAFMKRPTVRHMGSGRDLHGLRKDGSEFSLEIGIHPFVSNRISYVLLSIIDITERKKTEAQLESMFNLAPFAMLLVDFQGQITRINLQAEKLFGYEPKMILGKSIEQLIPEEFREQHPDFREEYVKSPHPKNMGQGRDLYALSAKGQRIPVEVGLTPFKIEDETFILAAVIDISSRKAALRTLEEHSHRLMVAKEVTSEFISNMSHEFRTPLHSVLSFAKFGRKKVGKASDEKILSYFQQIEESGDYLLELVNQILDLSKLEANRMRYEFQPTPLFEFTTTCLEKTRPWLVHKKLSLEMSFPPEDIAICLDAQRIQQVIHNLISNAIKFSDDETTIRIEGFVSQEVAGVCISNRGIKVPELERKLIFEKFFQSSFTKTGAGGTGLGLSLCKNIIADHGGEIWCGESTDGETQFIFELPRSETD
jgi:PAS domain S-box-containing protein